MKYKVTFAYDVPCYGEVEIDAPSEDEAVELIHAMWRDDTLMIGDYEPDVMLAENYRVVQINDDCGNCVDDGFDLP